MFTMPNMPTPPFEVAMAISAGMVILFILLILIANWIINRLRGG